jgi:hypothetical protein
LDRHATDFMHGTDTTIGFFLNLLQLQTPSLSTMPSSVWKLG